MHLDGNKIVIFYSLHITENARLCQLFTIIDKRSSGLIDFDVFVIVLVNLTTNISVI